MDTLKHILLIVIGGMSICLTAQSIDHDAIADRIVNQSLVVRSGEVVQIVGAPQESQMLEALYVAVFKAGGIAQMQMYLPEAELRVANEVDPAHIAQPLWSGAVQRRLSDCLIVVESMDDPERWKDLSPEVLRAFRESAEISRAISRHDRRRIVVLGQQGGIPTPQMAAYYGVDYEVLTQNFWQAIGADHETLLRSGKMVINGLTPGARITVRTPDGTDIAFRLADQEAMTSCGKTTDQKSAYGNNYAWLPAGDAFTSIALSSASGKIAVPVYYSSSGKKYTNLRVTFENGLITDLQADQQTAGLEERFLGKGTAEAPLSSINIGLNSFSKPLGNYQSFEMAGMVSLGIGDNDWAGGEFESGLSYFFHLSDATMTVNEKVLIKNGELKAGWTSN